MKKYRWGIILLNLVVLLIYFNYSVAEKETLLAEGKLVLLELAPVDPRSLMQGDYMNLRYRIAEEINRDQIQKRGYCVLTLEPNGVARNARLVEEIPSLNEHEYPIKYTAGNWSINLGAESFFFEEGQAEKFEAAKYGGLQVDKQGNSILVGLYDEDLNKIE